ncbi:hypothetical protein, unlikely [Trypanosoma brucei gambiense DAL972]|uniref:Uncharacterized protein n=1 Tax=Trypanosoma brucei gambiense (strain MHOM/CI/86/DAL972) TaxID=679716 RepID=C9ZP59_TRYB9|nr:hypothetical protein, unlikely [Trypanosoma brucei gambiense DAL972]CBH11187.1 hypothetical protein, unlikely [Trypanosoma brucei gambiense DAL972]|eukprot:XP_011773474.1 hypothetical protein, unlikely [Trypanosoma brucei gambiense DAL972]
MANTWTMTLRVPNPVGSNKKNSSKCCAVETNIEIQMHFRRKYEGCNTFGFTTRPLLTFHVVPCFLFLFLVDLKIWALASPFIAYFSNYHTCTHTLSSKYETLLSNFKSDVLLAGSIPVPRGELSRYVSISTTSTKTYRI